MPLITVPYVSRVLGPENIGIINFSTSYSAYFGVFAGLGISLYGSREVAKLKDNFKARNKLFSELFLITIFSSFICSILYVISIFSSVQLIPYKDYLLISGITLYLSSFSLDWFYAGREKFKFIAIRSISIKIISLILIFSFVKNEIDGLLFLSIGVFSLFINNIWNFCYLIKNEVKISFSNVSLKVHIKPMLILLSTTLAVSVYTTLDTIMLGLLSDFNQVGFYTSATKISRLLLPFAVVTTTVLVPRISYEFKKNNINKYNYYLNKSFDLICFFAIPMGIGLFICSPSFVPIFFGHKFLPVIEILQILSSVLIFVGLSNFFGVQVLTSAGLESKLLISILCGACINFFLNLFLIPKYGAISASIASVVAEIIILVLTVYMVKIYTKVKVDWNQTMNALYSSVPMFLFYLIIPNFIASNILQLILIILFGVISYAITQHYLFKNKIILDFYKHFKSITSWI